MCSVTQLFQCMLSKTLYGVPWSPELPVHGKELSCRDPIGLEGHSPQPVPACNRHIRKSHFCLLDAPQIRIVTPENQS